MVYIDLNTRVAIKASFFANEAKNVALKAGYENWKPYGIVKKNTSVMFPINSLNGKEWEIPDNYHVLLDNNPFIKGTKLLVTFLNEDDIEIINQNQSLN